MGLFYTDAFLRMLRNKVNINKIISVLNLETRYDKEFLRFRCPLCYQFHTATNLKTNLARCFDCQANFNPIDLVMAVTRFNFIDSVEFLKKYILSQKTER
ncbi:DnaG5 [Candidatus Magnetomorum sp. HK-1]|nr:DnaG5 [Candidatus Magnetomorum sp. HK-1]